MKLRRNTTSSGNAPAVGRRIALTALLGVALLLLSQAAPAYAAKRVSAHVRTGKTTLRAPLRAATMSEGLSVSDMSANTAEDLVRLLVGDSDIPISNIRYTGSPAAGGMFTGGTGIIGFEGGIVLSTGMLQNVVGPNLYDDVTGQNGTPGDASLGPASFDAAVLEFDFVPNTDAISFQYVFASDEYNEWANSDFNDVFAFFVNRMNQALVPDIDVPVSINTINGGNPVGTDPQNAQYFVNNENPFSTVNTEMDGLTTVLTLQSPVNRGEVNHLKLAIADIGDDQWDSNVFIKAGSFSGGAGAPPETTALATPAPNVAGWNNSHVSVSLHAIPTVPGDTVKEVHYQIDGASEVVVPGDNANFVITSEGSVTVTYFAVDASDLAETAKTLVVKIDQVKPSITGVAYRMPNAKGWYNADVPIGFNCEDSLSGIATCLGYTTLGEGANQSVTGTATDKAGNVSTATVTGINVDKTRPVVTAAADRKANADGWYNAPVKVSFTCVDPLSGTVSCPEPVTLFAEGRGQSTSGTATDWAGNTASATIRGINLDLTAPITTVTAPSGWQQSDATVTFTATDSLSGVSATYYTVDGGALQTGSSLTVTADGVHTVKYWSVDKAGNAEQAQTVTVQIDRAAPTITHSQSPAPNANGWNNTDVAVTFTCHDTNGIASCTGNTTVTAEGQGQVVTGTATDTAGKEATDQATINIDRTDPITTATTAPTGGQNHGVIVTLAATDNLSGVKTTYYKLDGGAVQTGTSLTVTTDGTHTVQYWSVDQAGNTEQVRSITVQIATTPPVITHTQSPAPNPNGWNNTDVTITFTCSGGSGALNCPAPVTLTSEGKGQVVTGTVTDSVGNTATDKATVNIDKTAPAVTYTGNQGAYTVDQQVNITCSASDSLSGVAAENCKSVTGSAYTFTWDANTVTASATDRAGNTGTARITFTVSVTYDGTCASIDQLVPQHGVANSLCVKIRNAQAAEQRGQLKTKANILQAYLQEVSAQRGKWITPANADLLTRLGNYLLAHNIGGGSGAQAVDTILTEDAKPLGDRGAPDSGPLTE